MIKKNIDFPSLFNLYRRHVAWIVLVSMLSAIAMYCVSRFLVTEKYECTAEMYVNSQLDEQERTTPSIIAASKALIQTAGVLLKSDDFLTRVGQSIDPPLTAGQIRSCVSYSAINDTETMKISVITTDKKLSYILCSRIAQEAPSELLSITDAGHYKIYDQPDMPEGKCYPSNPKYAVTGALVAAVAYVLILFFIHLFDDTVKHVDDIKVFLGLPILGVVPGFEKRSKQRQLVAAANAAKNSEKSRQSTSNPNEKK